MSSVRRLLLVALVGTLSAGMAVAGAFSYRAGLREAGEMFDAKLAHSARVLMSLVDDSLGDLVERPASEPLVIQVWHGNAEGHGPDLISAGGHAYETKLAFQARDRQGRLLLRSESGPGEALAPLAPGYADVRINGSLWRTFTLRAPSGRWYQAGELSDIREEIAGEIAFGTLLPLLLALPMMALMIWLAVSWASRGLVRISAEIESRAPDRLSPIQLERVPREIQGLVKAVNGLLSRLDAAFARERRFTADAAHELRTPVAAVKVHADNLRMAVGEEQRKESQGQLDASVRRIERAISQLLALSRMEAGAVPVPRQDIDFAALVRGQAEDHAEELRLRHIALAAELDAARVCGDPAALAVLVRNLLDNAIRYSPESGRIRLAVLNDGKRVQLVVEDSGPGIPSEARERVFGRFHRELGTGVEGSGLGLSIVAQVLDSHGGSITLDDSPALGGLRATVTLPAA